VVALAHERLLDELVKGLHIVVVDDLRQHSQRVCFNHIVFSLLDVFGQALNDNEYLVFVGLKLLDEDVDESAEVLMLGWACLEELGHIEEH